MMFAVHLILSDYGGRFMPNRVSQCKGISSVKFNTGPFTKAPMFTILIM